MEVNLKGKVSDSIFDKIAACYVDYEQMTDRHLCRLNVEQELNSAELDIVSSIVENIVANNVKHNNFTLKFYIVLDKIGEIKWKR